MVRCKVKDCDKPVYGAIPMPTKHYDGVELWHYCELHYKMFSAVNNMITKIVGETEIRKRAFKGK